MTTEETTPDPAEQAAPGPAAATAPDPAAVRKGGLVNAGIGLGGIVLGRGLVELELLLGVNAPMIAGTMVVMFPVVAAFGLTTFILGRETGWMRIPLVVLLTLPLIAFAFYVIIPSGFRLSGH